MAPQTAPARQNLPPESDALIGRERDLSDLLRLLDTDRVITLCGADGVGKTRLALRLAALSTASFPDGVWLAALGDARTAGEVASRIASALGVAEEARRDLADTLCDALHGRRLLLVLDACDGVADHVAALGGALVASCPELSLLITAGDPVGVADESAWWVPPLPLPRAGGDPGPDTAAAVRLFAERARAASPGLVFSDADLAVAADVCRRLDGNPLGIELAAAWAGRLPLDRIAAGVAERVGPRTGDPRCRARPRPLRGVLEWSHALLSEPERVLLRRLSVFPHWDLELAERVCSGGPLAEADILDLLASLVDRGLIALTGEHRGRVRYRLPAPVRRFAAAHLVGAGEEEAVRERHCRHLGSICADLGRMSVLGRAMPWRERFGHWHRVIDEYDNVRAALHWAVAGRRVEDGLRMCVGLRPFWVTGYHFTEGCRWSDVFLDMGGGPPELRGRALVGRAELAWARLELDSAIAIAEEGMRLCRAADDTEPVVRALNVLAMVDLRLRAYDRAGDRLAEALKLSRETGDLWNEAIALGTLGTLSAQLGDLVGAETRYNTALMILRGMDHRWGVGVTLIGQGTIAEAQGDLYAADRCYREALDIQRDIGAAPELARCLAGVGRIAHGLGATAQAYDYLSEGLLLGHATGQLAGVAEALLSLARVVADQDQPHDAHRFAGAAAALREHAGVPPSRRPWPAVDGSAPTDPELVACWDEGATLDVDGAVALALDVTDAGRRARPRPPLTRTAQPPAEALTPREQEIARLVGQGGNNRAIAERLFIAPATVARHVANINRKMGFNSRKQIAAWVNRHSGPR
jgi:predicted ATPase/DNA-binding CsgD family transcriptional regulator